MKQTISLTSKLIGIALAVCLTSGHLSAAFAQSKCSQVFDTASRENNLSWFTKVNLWARGAHSPEELAITHELRRVIKKDFEGGGYFSGLTSFEVYPEARTLIKSLAQLKTETQERLIAQIHSGKSPSVEGQKFRDLLLLALFDRRTWTQLTRDLRTASGSSVSVMSYLGGFEKQIPTSLREDILREIGANYLTLSKDKDLYPQTPPKRLVDFYLKILMQEGRLIEERIGQGETAQDAYLAYWNSVETYVHVNHPYNPALVMELLRDVRASLVAHPPKDARETPAIYVGGSVPNARGDLAVSDLDLTSNFQFEEALLTDLKQRTQTRIQSLNPQTEFHVSDGNVSKDYWGNIHPVAFRVRPDGIDMLVYKSSEASLKVYSDSPGVSGPNINVFVHQID